MSMRQVAKLRIVRHRTEALLDSICKVRDEEGVMVIPEPVLAQARRLLDILTAQERILTREDSALNATHSEGWDA